MVKTSSHTTRKYQKNDDEDESKDKEEEEEEATVSIISSSSSSGSSSTSTTNGSTNNIVAIRHHNSSKPKRQAPIRPSVVTIVPKPDSQVTLVSTLTNSSSTNTLKTSGRDGFINNAYYESEPNLLFTVSSSSSKISSLDNKREDTNSSNNNSIKSSKERAPIASTASTTLKQSSSIAVLHRQSGGAGSPSQPPPLPLKIPPPASSSSLASSAGRPLSPRKSFTRRAVFIIPCIVVFLIVACGIIAGIIYVIVKTRGDMESSKTNYIENKWGGIGIVNTTPKPPPLIPDHGGSIAAGQQTNKIPHRTCGIQKYKPNIKLMRIMRGNAAAPFSWPWTVSIGYYGPRSVLPHACGGTLLNKRYIVTATHCVLERSIYSLVGNPIPNSNLYNSIESMMRVYVGVTNRTSDITTMNTYRVSKITSYPNFDTNSFKNDLSIIKLERDIVETDYLSYICLDKHTNTQPNTDVYAVGWGFTDTNFYKASEVLNQVKVQIRQADSCGLAYIPVLQFCAGDPKLGKDTCNGDSGGPLMQQQSDNHWSLVGIVSNGDAMCTGRGIYTNVSFFYDWIIENTKL